MSTEWGAALLHVSSVPCNTAVGDWYVYALVLGSWACLGLPVLDLKGNYFIGSSLSFHLAFPS